MSEENVEAGCASCGVAKEVDDIKLKECTDYDLVQYCSVKCQKEHKSHHQQECKKRAAELRDEILFKQPEGTHRGDCPICCLPLAIDRTKSIMTSCCCKVICKGCAHANGSREREEKLGHSCPFCRKPVLSEKQLLGDRQMMKRVAANDPVATRRKGIQQYEKGDYRNAFEYYTRAAELGDAAAQCNLARLYSSAKGVEKDEGKAMHHLEEAAIGGHPSARRALGLIEWNNGNTERALKHFIIGAKLGENDSIKKLMDAFRNGLVSKEDLASALRAHQAAADATKSPQRDIAP